MVSQLLPIREFSSHKYFYFEPLQWLKPIGNRTMLGVLNGFTLLFEVLLFELMKRMPVLQAEMNIKITENRLSNIINQYKELGWAVSDYFEFTMAGMDEATSRRGNDYVKLFVDLIMLSTL